MSIDNIPHVITAACVLHNICEIHHEHFNDAWLQIEGEYAQPDAVASRDTATGLPQDHHLITFCIVIIFSRSSFVASFLPHLCFLDLLPLSGGCIPLPDSYVSLTVGCVPLTDGCVSLSCSLFTKVLLLEAWLGVGL